MLNAQIEWMLENGGATWVADRVASSASTIYGWADAHSLVTPFVNDPVKRSHVVATIDLDDSIEATAVSAVLRAHGIVDTDSYRKLGRNQLRVGMFPAIDPSDIERLTACIDHVMEQSHHDRRFHPNCRRNSHPRRTVNLPLRNPVMVVALEGWFDMAGAASAAVEALFDDEHRITVGEIEPDPSTTSPSNVPTSNWLKDSYEQSGGHETESTCGATSSHLVMWCCC